MVKNVNMNFIPLMVPSIEEEDIHAVEEVLRSGMLVQDKKVAELEKSIKNIVSTTHAMAVSNGTASLHLALLALYIKNGDEVIIPAFSYVATANAVELVGAKPIFVDIDISTFNIDVSKIESHITSKTKAIMPVHEFGLACDITQIKEIGEKKSLYVIEDAACALGAMDNEQPVGSFGNFGSFSFHPRKSVTSGEGGMVTTNNDELAEKIQILRNHGIQPGQSKMEFVAAGFNYRLTEFQAALVNSQLMRLQEIIYQKQQLAKIYLSELDSALMQLPIIPSGKNHTWQTFHVVLNERYNRDDVIEKLKQKGIGSNYGAQCIPATKFYQDKYKLDCKLLFPNALNAYKQGLALPLYNKLNEENIRYIANELNQILKLC